MLLSVAHARKMQRPQESGLLRLQVHPVQYIEDVRLKRRGHIRSHTRLHI